MILIEALHRPVQKSSCQMLQTCEAVLTFEQNANVQLSHYPCVGSDLYGLLEQPRGSYCLTQSARCYLMTIAKMFDHLKYITAAGCWVFCEVLCVLLWCLQCWRWCKAEETANTLLIISFEFGIYEKGHKFCLQFPKSLSVSRKVLNTPIITF